MRLGHGTQHVEPVDLARSTAVYYIVAGATGVNGYRVEALHPHALLAAWQVRQNGRLCVEIAATWDSDSAILSSGAGAQLIAEYFHAVALRHRAETHSTPLGVKRALV